MSKNNNVKHLNTPYPMFKYGNIERSNTAYQNLKFRLYQTSKYVSIEQSNIAYQTSKFDISNIQIMALSNIYMMQKN